MIAGRVMTNRIARVALAGLLVLGALACGGGASPGPPVAAAERALVLASRADKLGFAKTLASGPRGKSTADIQLEILSEWLWLRGFGGLALEDAELDGWDAPRLVTSTSSTAKVATVLRFRAPSQPPERPVPLEIELVLEGAAWRLADARLKPVPAWLTAKREEAGQEEPDTDPTLAEIAATYRPPPPTWKRDSN